MKLNPAVESITTSPIAEAFSHVKDRAGVKPFLDLSQAAPSYPTASVIVDRIRQVATETDGGRYAPCYGIPELVDAFAAELTTDYAGSVRSDQVMIVAGCNQAFCSVSSALAGPGDEVIVAMPFYFNHVMWLQAQQISPVFLEVDESGVPSVEAVAALITPRTRAVLLVSPGNPTGAIIPPATIEAFVALARDAGIALILDETYRNFRGTEAPAHDLFATPYWDDTLISLHSFSKDLAIPGYRVGAIVGGERLLAEVAKIQDCIAISAPRIGQEAVLAGLRYAAEWRAEQTERIFAALGSFRTAMADAPGGFELVQSGAFFGWVRHPFASSPTTEVVRRLVTEQDLLAIPGAAFTDRDRGLIRMSFANLDADAFGEVADRLTRLG